MRKEYFNALTRHPRYVKVLITIAAVMVVSAILLATLSYQDLEKRKTQMSTAQYQEARSLLDRRAMQSAGLTLLAGVLIPLIVHLKRKTRIIITHEGIEYKTVLKSKFIPWDKVKDFKIINPGQAFEAARIRGDDKSISFNVFYMDASGTYKYTSNAMLDEHGENISGELAKSKLYKEVKSRIRK